MKTNMARIFVAAAIVVASSAAFAQSGGSRGAPNGGPSTSQSADMQQSRGMSRMKKPVRRHRAARHHMRRMSR